MSYEALEISWISCALFFALAQAVMAVVVACSPRNADRAIPYYRWIRKPLEVMLNISFLPLLFAVIISWVYFSLQTEYVVSGYTVSSIITVLGIIFYIMSYILIRRTLLSHFADES